MPDTKRKALQKIAAQLNEQVQVVNSDGHFNAGEYSDAAYRALLGSQDSDFDKNIVPEIVKAMLVRIDQVTARLNNAQMSLVKEGFDGLRARLNRLSVPQIILHAPAVAANTTTPVESSIAASCFEMYGALGTSYSGAPIVPAGGQVDDGSAAAASSSVFAPRGMLATSMLLGSQAPVISGSADTPPSADTIDVLPLRDALSTAQSALETLITQAAKEKKSGFLCCATYGAASWLTSVNTSNASATLPELSTTNAADDSAAAVLKALTDFAQHLLDRAKAVMAKLDDKKASTFATKATQALAPLVEKNIVTQEQVTQALATAHTGLLVSVTIS